MPDASALPAGLTPEMVVALAATVAVLLVVVAAVALGVLVTAPRRRLRKRMSTLGLTSAAPGAAQAAVAAGRAPASDSAAARQKRIQEKLRELEERGTRKARRRNQIRLDVVQAGVDWSLRSYTLVMMTCGATTASVLLALNLGPLVATAGAIVGALGLPRALLRLKAARRRKAFTREFANALDVLVRGLRSGLPVGECMAIVARESPEPVCGEFRQLVEATRLGMELEETMQRALERMPTPEYRFFAIVLQIQRQTGGNLAETLANLSTVLRDRKRLRDKVKAMSSEAKASAGIIGSLPFIVGGLVALINVDYILVLFTDFAGNVIVVGGLMWMAVGIAVMAKMINFRM